MKYNNTRNKAKIILVPYPAQGHVTPMLKLAATFSTHGFAPVVITPEFIHHRIAPGIDPATGISLISIPDGLDETTPRDFFSIEMAMENNMPVYLQRVVEKLKDCGQGGGGGVECMIVDLLASRAINVADQCGVKVAGFWPAMLATYRLIAAIPEMVSLGIISETGIPLHQGPIYLGLNQPILGTEDLPWLIGSSASRISRFKFWKKTMDRTRLLPWLLVNTFPGEFGLDNKSQNEYPRIFPVGPLGEHTSTKSPCLWKEDASCLDWLDEQSDGSVIYISFGSWVSPIGEGKVRSLAMALEALGRPFIWVLGPKWREGLPIGYLERVVKLQGKVVSWAPQLEVLQHKAVGCYLTHCGWNSTLEAIQCKKPLLCYPIAGDQFVNCSYIANVWRIGTKIEGFGRNDVRNGLKRVMEDDDMIQRLTQLNERIIGTEANLVVIDNLRAFLDDLKGLTIESSLD